MSARQADIASQVGLAGQRLSLSPNAVRFHKNGIEFRTLAPIAAWTEMTVSLQPPKGSGKLKCTGIVVACEGSRASGYAVSIVFTNLSPQSQALLSSWTLSATPANSSH